MAAVKLQISLRYAPKYVNFKSAVNTDSLYSRRCTFLKLESVLVNLRSIGIEELMNRPIVSLSSSVGVPNFGSEDGKLAEFISRTVCFTFISSVSCSVHDRLECRRLSSGWIRMVVNWPDKVRSQFDNKIRNSTTPGLLGTCLFLQYLVKILDIDM